MSLPEPIAALEPDPPTFDSDRWVGRTIDDRYRIERLLGEGGMGAVFVAEHIKLAKKVALKVILPQFAGDGELAERFAREAMASAKLDHPHVASALDYGALPEGGAYLVMQYVRGRTLRDALEAGEGGWAFACEVGAQIADALAAAHTHRIVHRDLKPENVMLEPRDGDGELVKVLDFGVARVAGDVPHATPGGGKQLTRVGTIVGTPGYMAPEQALGEIVDERADLYALGCILYEIIAREQLFTEEDLTAIVTRQLTMTAPRLSRIAPSTPPELEEVVARCLSHKRDERPSKAAELRDLLKRLALSASLERAGIPLDRISGSIAVGAAPTMHASHAVMPAARRDAWWREVPTSSFVALGALLGAIALTAGAILALDTPAAPALAAPLSSPPSIATPAPTTRAAPSPTSPIAPPPAPEGLPSEVMSDVLLVTDASDRRTREASSERLRALPEGSVPEYARAMAELELGRGCREKREAVRTLARLGDARARPAIERWRSSSRRGCGFLRSQDCWRCMRPDLDDAARALGGS